MSKLIVILLAAFVVASCMADASLSGRSFSRLGLNSKPAVRRIKLERRIPEFSLDDLIRVVGQNGGSSDSKHIVPLVDLTNTEYIGVMGIGTPEQKFRTIFNTGASELTVISKACNSPGCNNHNKYDSSKSSTYVKNGKSVKTYAGPGILSQDTIKVADITVANQTFSELVSTQFNDVSKYQSDIEFGLALSSKFYGTENSIMQNMIDQKLIDEPVVSFYLNKLKKGNEMIIGGTDNSLYKGDITYIPSESDNEWKFKIDSMLVRDSTNSSDVITKTCQSGCKVLIQSGASLIFGPKKETIAINEAIGAQPDSSNTVYIIQDCTKESLKTMPNVEITLGGKTFVLTPQMYSLPLPMVPVCLSSFFPFDISYWVIGDAFMRPYYTVFDYGNKRIGFARAV